MPDIQPSATQPRVSIVIPAHNEAGTISATLDRIREVASSQNRFDVAEIIVVSDGSTDDTYRVVEKDLKAGPGGVVVQLVRNAGSHNAIRCGLRYATGDLVAIISADGQDPPESLPEMLAAFRPGIDVVWGKRASRDHDPAATRLLAGLYYRIFRVLTGLEYPPAGLDFVVISRRVVEALLDYRERNLSLFLMLYNLGFGDAEIQYDRGARTAGESSWTLRKRLKLAVDMLTAFSAAPIRLVSLLGLVVGLLGLLFGGVTVVRGLMGDVPIEGWASLMVITSLMGGLILVGIALIGEYLWRTLDEARARPLYVEERSSRVDYDN
jgi:dolichol-phosphate mannosyltransferase